MGLSMGPKNTFKGSMMMSDTSHLISMMRDTRRVTSLEAIQI